MDRKTALRMRLKQIIREERARGTRHDVISRPQSRRLPRLTSILFEDAQEIAQDIGLKPITVVLLYGPPAAGKGAAQKDAPKFAGINSEQDYEKFLKAAPTFAQEEDAAMVSFTTGQLPQAVFKSLFDRVTAGEKFEDIIGEYYHVNESGKKFELKSILSAGAFKTMFDKGRDAGADEFKAFKNTEAYFTQARGFTNPGSGLPDLPEKAAEMLGPNDGSPTIGARLMAANKYMSDIKDEMKSIIKGDVIADSPYSTIYLADQAGESTANTDRITALGELKGDPNFPGLKLIGIYIHQPAERTKITNLHRAATGGRRVAQKEVDRIFAAAPKIEGGKIVEKGPAIEAMEAAGFDQIHIYYPPNPLDPGSTKSPDGRPLEDAICEPFGDGTGALDIEGCEETGSVTTAKSLPGMEQFAAKKAGLEVDPKTGLPEDLSAEDKKKVVQALSEMGFSVSEEQLSSYLKNVQPPGMRSGGKHGKLPWSAPIFGEKGRDPSERITVKGESRTRNVGRDQIIVERWQKLAGILKG